MHPDKIEKILIYCSVGLWVLVSLATLSYERYEEYSMKKQGYVEIGESEGLSVWAKVEKQREDVE